MSGSTKRKQGTNIPTSAFSPELSATAVLCKTKEMPAFIKKAFQAEERRLAKEIDNKKARKAEANQREH